MGCLQSKTEETRSMMIVPRACVHSCTDLWEIVREQSDPAASSVLCPTSAFKEETKADLSSKEQTCDLAKPAESPVIASAETTPDVASEKEIGDLADDDLAQIFTYLSPYDRLVASEACRRWYDLGRRKWLNVTELDLGPIPSKHIGAIVHQCPNLRSVFALNKCFDVGTLTSLSRSSCLITSTVKLYDCTFAVKSEPSAVNECLAKIFSPNLPQASWTELVLHGARTDDRSVPGYIFSPPFPNLPSFTPPKWVISATFLPATLTRLQLSGFYVRYGTIEHGILDGLEHLRSLECLILHQHGFSLDIYRRLEEDLIRDAFIFNDSSKICEKIGALKNLKELCIGPVCWISQRDLECMIANLPKLEVLFLNDADCNDIVEVLRELITRNATLRVLILSVTRWLRLCSSSCWLHQIELPARKRFPNGFAGDPLPLMHIFVGRTAWSKFLFSTSPADAAVVHVVDGPLPQFLIQAEIAPIFEGVWLAEKIKETAENVCKSCELKTWK